MTNSRLDAVRWEHLRGARYHCAVMRVILRSLLHAGAATLLAACAPLPPPAPGIPPAPAAPQAALPQVQTEGGVPSPAPVPVAPPVPVPPLLSLEDYRRLLAERIVQANAAQVFDGAPPPMLRSVVVLNLRLDAAGQLLQSRVLRGNGQHELEQRALRSIALAAPLPAPGPLAGRRGELELSETWLFRADGQFQLRTLAEPQAAGS